MELLGPIASYDRAIAIRAETQFLRTPPREVELGHRTAVDENLHPVDIHPGRSLHAYIYMDGSRGPSVATRQGPIPEPDLDEGPVGNEHPSRLGIADDLVEIEAVRPVIGTEDVGPPASDAISKDDELNEPMRIGLAFGYAVHPSDGADRDALLENARTARIRMV